MYKIGVIGDYDSICGFSALGLEVFPVNSAEEAMEKLKTLAGGGYGIIYVTEPFMRQMEEQCSRLNEHAIPSIIPIPSCRGERGYGRSRLKGLVEKAVGADIIFNDGE